MASSFSKRTPTKNLMLFSGRAHPVLAQEVADLLEIDRQPHINCTPPSSHVLMLSPTHRELG